MSSSPFIGSPNGSGDESERSAGTAIARRELLDLLPRGLAAALAHEGAMIREIWGERGHIYLRAGSRHGDLFGRYSSDSRDELRFAHELAVRRIVGEKGYLRAPAIIDGDTGWLLEVAIEPEPCRGAHAVDTVLAAASALAELRLPEVPPGLQQARGWRRELSLIWYARSARPRHADVLQARRLLEGSSLLRVTSHGDFRPENVLLSGGSVWVVDWEYSGMRPQGYDLMQFWCELERGADRERVFASALELVGLGKRKELERLRFAVAVTSAEERALRSHTHDQTGWRERKSLIAEARVAAGLPTRMRRRGSAA